MIIISNRHYIFTKLRRYWKNIIGTPKLRKNTKIKTHAWHMNCSICRTMKRMWICITSNYDITIAHLLISLNRCFATVILERLCKLYFFENQVKINTSLFCAKINFTQETLNAEFIQAFYSFFSRFSTSKLLKLGLLMPLKD